MGALAHPADLDLSRLSRTEVGWEYIKLGFEHILPLGLDHILFVLSLYLLEPRLKPVLVQATAFTVAHSITLGLASQGLIYAPPTIVEPLIALSIVFVAVENMLVRQLNRWRIVIVFAFGLIHGLGYRHLSAPTIASPVSDLTTPTGYAPRVNPAYNALPMPALTASQFPNIFGYDETRGGAATTDFAVGYFSPNSLADILTPGRGYATYVRGGVKPDFMGQFTQTDLTVPGLTRTGAIMGGAEKAGWHLLGNPFPSPLDWDLVPVPTGLSSAIFVFKSTGVNQAGVYLSRQNGMGTLPNGLLALGAGFFARVTGAGPVSLTLPNSARPTLNPYTQPVQFRPTLDTRPALSLTLRQAGLATAVADEAVVYFEAGATNEVDDRFDGQRPAHNPGGVPTLSTLTGRGQELAVNGLPVTAFRAGTVIPLLLDVPNAGRYELALGQWANMPSNGVEVALLDRQSNTRTRLQPGAVYQFQAAAEGVDMARFALVFGPATGTPTGVSAAAAPSALVIWPNPASGQVQLAGGTPRTGVTVFDNLGRVVLRTQTDTAGAASLNLATLSKGVYSVRVGTLNQRLVVE